MARRLARSQGGKKGGFLTSFTNFSECFSSVLDDVAGAVTSAVTDAGALLKDDLREQTQSAGLGRKLALAWRHKNYPGNGKESAGAAALIFSKAPMIHNAFNFGGTVKARNSKYLAIPTKYVPGSLLLKTHSLKHGAGETSSLPKMVEEYFGRKLVLRPMQNKNGYVLWMPEAVLGRKGKGYKRASAGRIKQGRDVVSLPMFILVKQARHAKRLDIEGAVDRANGYLVSRLRQELG